MIFLRDLKQGLKRLDILISFLMKQVMTSLIASSINRRHTPTKRKSEFWSLRDQRSKDPKLESVSRLIRVLSEAFTHSVLDLSGAISEEILQTAVERADEVVVVLTAEIPAVWRTLHLIHFLEESGLDSKLKLLLNRAQSREDITVGDIEKTLKRKIFWKVPNNYRSTIAALNSGQAVVEVNHSNLAQSYEALAEALTQLKKAKHRKGFLGLFS